MSETQRNLFNNRRAGGLLIAGAFLFLAIVFVVRFPASEPVRRDPEPVKVRTFPPPRRDPLTTPPVFDSETFYCTIIDNNLFRPLGWTPPRPTEPYRLIGTILPRDANTPPRAILETTAGHQTYIVSLGDKLSADTEVISIEAKQVTLESNGQQRTLRLNTAVYLNPVAANREETHRNTPMRPQTPVNRPRPAETLTPSRFPTETPLAPPLSDWQTREGERIRLGDARLKNPEKWGLRRR